MSLCGARYELIYATDVVVIIQDIDVIENIVGDILIAWREFEVEYENYSILEMNFGDFGKVQWATFHLKSLFGTYLKE